MTWRAVWLRAQLTGIALSSLVWLVLSALGPDLVALVWLAGAVLVAAWPSRLVFRARLAGRQVSPADRELVLRVVAPIQSLRGRNQPELRASRRPLAGVAVGPGIVVVGEKLMDRLRSRRLSGLQFATLAARCVGVAAVNQSRLVVAVDLFCLPWSVVRRLSRAVVFRLPRRVLSTAFGRVMAGLVLVLAAVDLFQRGLWVSLVMVVLVGVAALTTGRFDRAWAVRLDELAQDGVRRCGLAQEKRTLAAPDPWESLLRDEQERRDREVWS
jgi:uncharacterized membrane protein